MKDDEHILFIGSEIKRRKEDEREKGKKNKEYDRESWKEINIFSER